MVSCYESLDNGLECQLKKIKCLFADRIYSNFKEIKYGIRPCKEMYSVLFLSDMKELLEYIYSMDLSNFDKNTYKNLILNNDQLLQMAKDGCIPEFAVETLKVCNISTLIEKINSL